MKVPAELEDIKQPGHKGKKKHPLWVLSKASTLFVAASSSTLKMDLAIPVNISWALPTVVEVVVCVAEVEPRKAPSPAMQQGEW